MCVLTINLTNLKIKIKWTVLNFLFKFKKGVARYKSNDLIQVNSQSSIAESIKSKKLIQQWYHKNNGLLTINIFKK